MPELNSDIISVYYSPTVVDSEDGVTEEMPNGNTLDFSALRREARANNNEPYHESTKGAAYVASQLPYLASLDSSGPQSSYQSAAIKWAHSTVGDSNWFGSSR